MARPCGAAVTSSARTNCGVAVEMSTTSTLLFAPSARYSWWEDGSATTPSNVPAATTGIAGRLHTHQTCPRPEVRAAADGPGCWLPFGSFSRGDELAEALSGEAADEQR